MKMPSLILKRSLWLLVLCFLGMLTLSACKSAASKQEHPAKSEHPTQEHPQGSAPAK